MWGGEGGVGRDLRAHACRERPLKTTLRDFVKHGKALEGCEQRSDKIKLMFNKITKAAVTNTDCWRQGLGNQGNQIISIPQFKKIKRWWHTVDEVGSRWLLVIFQI